MSERQTGATDETAMRLRSWSQRAGISNEEPWGEISDRRKEQWRRIARECAQDGQVITDAARVPTDEELAAIKSMRGLLLATVPSFDGSNLHVAISAYLERQR